MNAAIEFFSPASTHHTDCTCAHDEEHCMSDEHIEATDPVDPAALEECARACAQGWVEQACEDDAHVWLGIASVPDADVDFFEQQIGRPMTESEAAEFSQIFWDEYAACMQAKAARNGWDD